MESHGGMTLTGESRRTRLNVISSTRNPTWTDPTANPGLLGHRPATNRLSHGTAHGGFSVDVLKYFLFSLLESFCVQAFVQRNYVFFFSYGVAAKIGYWPPYFFKFRNLL
jgi:hypothetical protein